MGALYLSPSLKFMSRNTWLDISVSHLATCKTPLEKIFQSFILDFQMFWNCFDLHMMTKAVGSSRDGVVWPRGPRLNLADLQSFFHLKANWRLPIGMTRAPYTMDCARSQCLARWRFSLLNSSSRWEISRRSPSSNIFFSLGEKSQQRTNYFLMKSNENGISAFLHYLYFYQPPPL